MLELFATSLSAEKVIEIGPLSISNSYLYGLLSAAAVIVLLLAAAKRIKKKPGGTFASLVEVAVEYVIDTAANIMHDRKKAIRFAPLILSVFLFILMSNWFGLLPGVGSIQANGAPLFRGFTADLNGTLALAVFTIILVQIYAIKELGVMGHLKHYFSDKPWNPINLFVGILEVLGEFTRMASLSLRLFGNVFAGEVLLVTIAKISGYLSPITTLPFYFMELFVGLIQAFVFTMLTIVYLSVATHHSGEDSAETQADHSSSKEKVLANGQANGINT